MPALLAAHLPGKILLILHTLGAKSGKEHINPVAYVTDGDRFVIIASKGGAPTNPDWYYNIACKSSGNNGSRYQTIFRKSIHIN